MGWSEDLLLAGLITEEEYKQMQKAGKILNEFGNVEELEKIMLKAYDLGLEELGDRFYNLWNELVNIYEEMSDFSIYYNPETKRWHDAETHRFVKDPYVSRYLPP